MKFPRSSGVLLHPTSLPGRFGSGDLGTEALAFLRFLADAGQKVWQVLPLNPVGFGNSPYQGLSACAGNPLLISLERLGEQGWLSGEELGSAPVLPSDLIDYGAMISVRWPLLRKAARRFAAGKDESVQAEYEGYCAEHAEWLEDYALFMAAKDAHGGRAWTRWEPELAARKPEALARWRKRLAVEIAAYKFWQWEFFRQWEAVRTACQRCGIRVMGDLSFYVAHDSADVWTAPQYFCLDEAGNPLKVGGVPPDYFSATGQLWGNPIYRWEHMRADGYRWWKARMRCALRQFDVVRVDHFRGFEAYYEITAGAKTALQGSWIKAPGTELFEALTQEFGELPVVAENLGVTSPEVELLRERFRFPGMAILQFAFGNDPQAPRFCPHRYERGLVAYTGSHDNNTAVGWWTGGTGDSTRSREEVHREQERASAYLNLRGEAIHWAMIRALMASVADTVLFPLQDVLGLAGSARMNLPGQKDGNWRWRYQAGELRPELGRRLRDLAELYGR